MQIDLNILIENIDQDIFSLILRITSIFIKLLCLITNKKLYKFYLPSTIIIIIILVTQRIVSTIENMTINNVIIIIIEIFPIIFTLVVFYFSDLNLLKINDNIFYSLFLNLNDPTIILKNERKKISIISLNKKANQLFKFQNDPDFLTFNKTVKQLFLFDDKKINELHESVFQTKLNLKSEKIKEENILLNNQDNLNKNIIDLKELIDLLYLSNNSLFNINLTYHNNDLELDYCLEIVLFKTNGSDYFFFIFKKINDEIIRSKRLNEINNRLLSSYCHELKTPINGAIPLLEILLSSENISHNMFQNNLKIIMISLKILQNTIDNIFDYSLFESNQFYLNKRIFLIIKLINEIAEIIENKIHKKNINFILKIDSKIARKKIFSDYSRLRQLILNLLLNSIQYTLNGEIKLIISQVKNNKIDFEIEDTGIGIEEENLKKIMRKIGNEKDFINIGSTGSCLGLIVSQRIVYLLGNEEGLKINSIYGKGSSFKFSVYLDDAINMKKNNLNPNTLLPKSLQTFISTTIQNTKTIKEISQFNKIINQLKKKNKTFISNKDFKNSSNSFSNENSKSIKLKKLHLQSNIDFNSKFENKKFRTQSEELKLSKLSRKTHTIEFKSLGNSEKKEQEFSHSLEEISEGSIELKNEYEDEEIMIVDDDMFNLRVLEIQLKELNLKCIKANNGKEAIEILKEKNNINSFSTSIKLVFMDYQMPILDGVEATIQINELITNNIIKNTKIIGCTAFTSKDYVLKCLDAGMKAVIFKPLSRNLLKETLEEWLN